MESGFSQGLEHSDGLQGKGARRITLPPLVGLPGHEVIPLLFALCAAGGAALYFAIPREPSLSLAITCLALSILIALGVRRMWRFPVAYGAGLLVLAVSLGFAAGKLRTVRVEAPVLSAGAEPAMIEGWVTRIEPGAKGPRLRLKVHAVAGLASHQTPRHVRVTHTSRLAVSPGRFVRCWAVLRPPPAPSIPGDYDFARQAYYQRLGAVGYVWGRCRGGVLGPPAGFFDQAMLKVGALRRMLARHVSQAAGERAGGFAAALASGDRSLMEERDREALRNSGLAHLLAISGLHMGIVGGLIYALVFRGLALVEPLAVRMPVQKPAALTALLGSAIYLVLSGATVSTQRAFIMALVFFGAILFDRAAISFRSLAIAMILIVLMQPESVMSPGFQMSFAASGALIAVYQSWSRKRTYQNGLLARIRTAAWSIVKTSIVASAATAPFALYHFDRLAGLGLLANVLAMPIVSLVAAPAAALSLLLAPFGASEIGLRVFGYALEMVLAVAHWCSSFEGQGLHPDTPMPLLALGALVVGLIVFLFLGAGWRLLAAGASACAAMLIWQGGSQAAIHWAPNGDLYIIEAGRAPQRIGFADGDGLAPLRYSDLPVSRDCSEAACALNWRAYDIRMSHTPESCDPPGRNTLTFTLAESATPCPGQYIWQETSQTGGLTLKPGRNGILKRQTPSCGRRPWQICQD